MIPAINRSIPNVSTVTALIYVDLLNSVECVRDAIEAESDFQCRSAVLDALGRRMRVLRERRDNDMPF